MKGLFPNQVDRLAAERSRLLINDVPYMPVPRCDGCTHWTDTAESRTYAPMFGECVLLTTMRSQQWTGSMAVAFAAHFYTKADFGCVQWEAK